MSDFAPTQLPAPRADKPPAPCACCLRLIAKDDPYAFIYSTATAEEGFLCALCWSVARGSVVAFGAGGRERDRQTVPAAAKP